MFMKRKLKVLLVVGVIGGVGLAGSWVASRLPGRQVVVLDPLGSMSPEQVAAAELARSNGDEEVKLTVSAEKVEVLIPGESDWRAGENEMLLPVGSRVRTNEGGRAQIEYPGGTVTRLDNDSEVLLETVETGQEKFFGVRIMGGRVWSRVSRVLGKVTYETRSSNVVAAVRGTTFGVEIDEQDREKAEIYTTDGEVQVAQVEVVENKRVFKHWQALKAGNLAQILPVIRQRRIVADHGGQFLRRVFDPGEDETL